MKDETAKFITELFSDSRLLVALAVIVAVWLFTRGLQKLAEILADKFSRYRLFISSLFPVLRLLTWLIAIPAITFSILEPPMNTVLAITASAGLAIGLGAQDLIRNLIAGILILFDRPFRVGDMVKAGDHYGEITDIGLRSVTLHTFDDSYVTLPNSMVLGQAVSNSNTGELDEMIVTELLLPASIDTQTVREIAWEAAACSPYVYLKKPIIIIVEDHFDFTFLTRYKIKAYVLDVRLERLMASDITERIKQEINRLGLLPPAEANKIFQATGPLPPTAAPAEKSTP
ncbi:MAG: mechanosensitive ion channel [Desulfuromonadales bacterium]|nr:mechanosensitive ion channel [Desulfuromonadales bacterium]MDW7756671.1 mechanosensitive ion channel [Desulfuromonadales bacterium]